MATVIDSLVVQLGLDDSGFKRGSAETKKNLSETSAAARKTSQDMQDSGKKAAEFFKELRNQAVAFFAILTTGRGLIDFTRETITSNAELSRLSANLNETASDMFAWKRTVEQAGGDGNAFIGTIKGISSAITRYWAGDPAGAEIFKRFGIDIANVDGTAKKSTQLLLELADSIQSKKIDRTHAYNLLKSSGIDEGTINVIFKGRGAVEALLAAQKKKYDLDKAAADRAEKIREEWVKLTQRIDDFALKILERAIPMLEKLVDWLLKFSDWVAENGEKSNAFFIALTITLGLLAIPVIKLAAPFIALAAAIAAVSAALSKVYDWFKRLVESEAFKKFTNSEWFKRYSGATNAAEGGESIGIDPDAYVDRSKAAKAGAEGGGKGRIKGISKAQKASLDADDKALGLPQNSGYAQMIRESSGRSWAVSKKGARGWFQIMPDTQASLEKRSGRRFDPENFDDARIMRRMLMQENLQRFGNVPDALRAYNASPNRSKWNNSETRAYVESIERIRRNSLGAGAIDGRYANAAGSAASGGVTNVSNQTNVNGPINIQTQATDAKGIARDIRGSLASQADSGMS